MTDRNVPVTKGAANDRELTRLMAGLPGMVYRASAQSPFAFEIVGGGYERILGRSLDELTTKPDIRSTIMYPDDVARYRAAAENAVKCGDTFQIEYSVIYPDTTERVVWEQGGPVRAPDGSCFIEGSIIDIEGPVHARQVQDATYRISQVAASAESLQELYGRIHHIIAELMPSENLYFALRDPKTGFITYPYYIDECDVMPPDPQMAETGLTAYILRTGTPLLMSEFHEAEPVKSGSITPTGTVPISWLGVPLQLKGSTIGVMAVQVYHGSYRYTEQDRNILSFVADQVAVSIDRWRSRDALATSEERFRIAAQSTSDIVYEWDIAEDRTTYYGDLDGEFARAIGGFPSKGSQWDSYIHPDDLPVLHQAIQQHLKVHTPLRVAYRMRCTDGTWHTIVESSQAVLDKDGQVVKWIGTTADVTDRVVAENSLRDSEARMRALFATMNDIIIVLDKDSRYIEIAPTRGDLLYRPREELLGRTVRELFDSDLADRFLENIHKALANQSTVDMDYSLTIGQSHLWFEVRISPLTDERVLLVAHDATARHDAQEAVRVETSKAETYFNMSGVIIEVLDTDLHLVRLNQTGYDFFGYAPDEIVGKDWLDIRLPERERDRAKVFLRGELAGQPIPEHINGPVITRSGEERIISWHDSLLRDAEGRITGLISSGVDVTHTVHLEHELQRMDKLESLGVLAGGIAHDFNNMLTGIIGNINLARIEDDAAHSRELLEEAEREVLQARGLTQQLLTFAKGGAPVRSVHDLAHILQETVSFALRGSDVSASFDLPADLWWASIDKGQLSQVFSNIVINADEAMPAGGTISVVARNITVDDGAYPDLAPGDYVRIDLSDTGVGIAETDLRKIFDPFFSTKRRGSGLGLATSYAIVHKHDGTIGVVSTPGAGTTFSILLPAVPAGPSLRSPETAPRFSGHGHVLVMDDEPTVRQVAVAMLKKLGYEAEAVPDGASALRADAEARTAGRPFSVILMDLTIPGGMGGQEAAALFRENRTPAQLIASSGYATDSVMAHYRDYHFDGVLAKPYSFVELTSVLASLATQRSS
ncbi:PAS domain S-box protein [Candidatus Cryosericum hinesii]|jgi:PAS domain S-box-containing protein|uniref:histidine kinase n=1 Tax=Candidatus Cryosericum hinesii TaxID=2290915 RepID=A0A398DIN0_9BACT|nr:PAS domain-containing protein [Candidatus Cryosericum hinesii]RIE08889.1 PAS domain S-box protein [Candidatus Cryosericum hinesii]RIE12067.1 PAS domain S-box protein [Candidatus Cryosericum hinesii]RIE12751.1 PAS domain S-box protein [Candidatus Cryosericum hinesii]